jgi:two-component system sensor histidine kinase YesM
VKLFIAPLIRAFRFDVKLRQKLLISYLAIIVIPFVIVAIFISRKVSRIVEERIAYSADQAFDQAGAFLEYRLYNVLKVSHVLLVDRDVNAILLKDMQTYDLRSQRVDMDTLTNLFFSYQDGVNIDRIRLYVRDSLDYAEERVNLFGLGSVLDSRWYRYLQESGSTYVWCPSEYLSSDENGSADILSLARYIMDLEDLRKRVGVLRIDIKKFNVLSKSSAISDSITYIQNRVGDIVATSNAALLPRFTPFISLINEEYPPEGGMYNVSAHGEQAFVEQRLLGTTDWRIITVIPVAGIEAQSRSIRNQIFLVILAIAAAAYLLAYFVTGPVTRRLSGIITKMEGAKRGALEKLSLPAGRDEIGELSVTYNIMIDEITTLMAKEERSQRELKSAELKALQAQINPHFLYNTLDMIKWMSRRGMTGEIEELLTTLSTFYRLSLSEGRETIPVREELRHVELYARIQNMRFRGALDFSISVDPKVMDCGILRVTLQPLVENAILHGINEKPDKCGSIRITGGLEGGDVALAVEDDGVGMDQARLASLLDDSGTRRSGFGVRNIHERIRLYYGQTYGLTFESGRERGTRVTVRFLANPAVQEFPHL